MRKIALRTLIGRENPKLAQLQLGISAEIFNRHYNQPLLEDRMAKRDILPGADWTPKTPEGIAGTALLGLLSGELHKDDFEYQVKRARELEDLPADRKNDNRGYV